MRKVILQEFTTIDDFAADKEGITDKLNTTPKIVFSKEICTLNMQLRETKTYGNGAVFLRYGLYA